MQVIERRENEIDNSVADNNRFSSNLSGSGLALSLSAQLART
jgi:hypothetical protein